MERSATVDIHPGADVILLCGDEQYDDPRPLRVSSVFLAHASPVFKAMLGPHFSESNTLAASSGVEIPLPDDDPDAMEAICLALHMRNGDTPAIMTVHDLIEVLKLCDKYDVFVATRPVINLWLDACPDYSIDYDRAHELMIAAFHLKLWKAVNRFGIIMAQKAEADISPHEGSRMELPHLPSYIYDQLEMHREKTSRKLYAAVDEQVDLYLHPEKQSGKCNGDCEGVNAAKLHLIKQLRGKRLWPARRSSGRSLVSIKDSSRHCGITNVKVIKKCQPDCAVLSMKGAFQVTRLIHSAMCKVLDEMKSNIKFDSSEDDGMIYGFSASEE